MAETDEWLKAGMAALRAGRKDEARTLFLQLLEVDEQNEQAWLWLSGAMPTAAEQQICLENVLTINPNNVAAQRGLAKLGVSWPPDDAANDETDDAPHDPIPLEDESLTDEGVVVRREYAAVSTASALLHPENQVKEWRWHEAAPHIQAHESDVGYQAYSQFDDVWSGDEELCAYCAQPLAPNETKCPRCQRNLQKQTYRYEKTSTNLVVFWVLLLGVAQLFLFNGLFAFLAEGKPLKTAAYVVLAVMFGVLTIAVNLRQWWSHITAVFILGLLTFLIALQGLTPIDFSGLDRYTLDLGVVYFSGGMFQILGNGLNGLLVGAIVVGFGYALFAVAPDFDRVVTRETAALRKGLSHADHYHSTAKKLAQEGKLASAVLHWQRAAAKDPARLIYQRYLAQTYAQLGFYERSLNILNALAKQTTDPPQRAKLEKMVTAVQKQQQRQAETTTEPPT